MRYSGREPSSRAPRRSSTLSKTRSIALTAQMAASSSRRAPSSYPAAVPSPAEKPRNGDSPFTRPSSSSIATRKPTAASNSKTSSASVARTILSAGGVAFQLPITQLPISFRTRLLYNCPFMRSRLLYLTVVLFAVVAILFLASYLAPSISPKVITVFRAIALASFFGYAIARRSLTTWIVFSMFLGAEIGYDFPAFASNLRVLSQIFLQLIRTIIAPLLFGTLVSGIAGHANLKAVGRMGIKAILYFEIVTTLALVIGLTAINLSKAGVGIQMPPQATAAQALPTTRPTATDMLLHVFPENIAKSVAEGQVLQVVVFSMIFGIALAQVREEKRRPMLAFAESLTEVMFKFTNIVMLFAPIGVGAAVAYTIGHIGLAVLLNLAKLLATLYAALTVFLLGVLLPIAWFAGVPIKRFLRAIAEPASIAFGTSNSEAALPLAMEAMEGIGVRRQVVAFVMPLGYSFNSGWVQPLSLSGRHLRRTSRRRSSFPQPADRSPAHPDARQQRRRRRLARVGHHSDGNRRIVRTSGRAGLHPAWHRPVDGHGADVGKRDRQLSGDGRCRAVGRPVRSGAGPPYVRTGECQITGGRAQSKHS